MPSFALSLIVKLFGAKEIFGFTISEIVAWFQTPQGQKAIAVAKGVIEEYKKNGLGSFQAGIAFLASVAKIHRMTPAEERVWMERGKFAADPYHDFPRDSGQ